MSLRPLSLGQYRRFLTIGAIVGIVSVVCRQLIGWMLSDQQTMQYSVSVVVAYVIGIVLSFCLNGQYTFRTGSGRNWSKFPAFIAVAGVGLVTTWLLSLALNYEVSLDALVGRLSGTVAFIIATLLASIVTYPLNALFVFRAPNRSTLER